MRRIVVAGGTGFFGRTIVEQLRVDGFEPLVASRRTTADLSLDVEDRDSLRRTLQTGDVVVDAVGPFQRRTTQLVKAAINIGCDSVDIADSLGYVRAVYGLRPKIDAAGIRVFTACSSVSAITAAMIRLSGIAAPVRVYGFLVPATKHTAVAGTAASLFYSVGQPIEVYENGSLETRPGWLEQATFAMPGPLGTITGYAFETADAITLPAIWPSLRCVKFFIDTNVFGLNAALCAATSSAVLRRIVHRCQPLGLRAARWLGRAASGLGYEIEDRQGRVVRLALVSDHNGYITPVAPAVLVAENLARGQISCCGLVPADDLVDPPQLIEYLDRAGIRLTVF